MPDLTRLDKFPLGQVVMTAGVHDWCELGAGRKMGVSVALAHHRMGDWGEVCEEDRQVNEEALRLGNRLMSVHTVGDQTIWIITEADRSSTTILFPSEY